MENLRTFLGRFSRRRGMGPQRDQTRDTGLTVPREIAVMQQHSWDLFQKWTDLGQDYITKNFSLRDPSRDEYSIRYVRNLPQLNTDQHKGAVGLTIQAWNTPNPEEAGFWVGMHRMSKKQQFLDLSLSGYSSLGLGVHRGPNGEYLTISLQKEDFIKDKPLKQVDFEVDPTGEVRVYYYPIQRGQQRPQKVEVDETNQITACKALAELTGVDLLSLDGKIEKIQESIKTLARDMLEGNFAENLQETSRALPNSR